MTSEPMTSLQDELTKFYEQDVCRWIKEQQKRGRTYREISITIASDTGWRIQPTTLARWMSYWRNGR